MKTVMEKKSYTAPVCQVSLFTVEPILINSNSFGNDPFQASDDFVIPDYSSEEDTGSL